MRSFGTSPTAPAYIEPRLSPSSSGSRVFRYGDRPRVEAPHARGSGCAAAPTDTTRDRRRCGAGKPARVVDQEAARRRHVAADQPVAGVARRCCPRCSRPSASGSALQVVLEPGQHREHVARAVVVPDQRRLDAGRVLRRPAPSRRRRCRPCSRARIPGSTAASSRGSRGARGTRTGSPIRSPGWSGQVVVGDAVGIARAADAGAAAAARLVPARAAPFEVDHACCACWARGSRRT